MRPIQFRCHHHGAEVMLGAQADLVIYGRSIANGRNLAAVCGPRHLLDPAQAMPEACADAALAAAVATLRLMDDEPVTTAIRDSAQTGRIGDGKIFVFDLEHVTRIRTGETGTAAL